MALHNSSCDTIMEDLPSQTWNIVFGILIVLVSIFAFIENSFILMLYYKYPNIRNPSNYILVSVVIADWLTGLTSPIYSCQLLNKNLRDNCDLHKVRRVFGVTIMDASLGSILFMTIDRARRLILLRSYSMEMKWIYIGLLSCWLTPVACGLAGLTNEVIHSDIILAFGVIIIGVIIFSYTLVIFALRKQGSAMENSLNMAEYEKKAVKTVILIITCYLLMLAPHIIENGLYAAHILKKNKGRAKAHIFTVLLIITNSIVNPIIYASRIRDIRKYSLKTVGSKRRQTEPIPLRQYKEGNNSGK